MNLKSSTGMLPYGLGGCNVTACDEVHSGLQAAARWITCILLLGRFHALKQRISSAEETDTDAASMSSALGTGGNGTWRKRRARLQIKFKNQSILRELEVFWDRACVIGRRT
jgi:hypothetical protein